MTSTCSSTWLYPKLCYSTNTEPTCRHKNPKSKIQESLLCFTSKVSETIPGPQVATFPQKRTSDAPLLQTQLQKNSPDPSSSRCTHSLEEKLLSLFGCTPVLNATPQNTMQDAHSNVQETFSVKKWVSKDFDSFVGWWCPSLLKGTWEQLTFGLGTWVPVLTLLGW